MNVALPPASPGPCGTASREGMPHPARVPRAFHHSPSLHLVSWAGCFLPALSSEDVFPPMALTSCSLPKPQCSVPPGIPPFSQAGLLPGRQGCCCHPGTPSPVMLWLDLVPHFRWIHPKVSARDRLHGKQILISCMFKMSWFSHYM